MSPYQVLEHLMELLETLGCIWSSKGVKRRMIGREEAGATYRGRCETSLQPERPWRPKLERPLQVARLYVTRRWRKHPGATPRSDHPRSLPRARATCWSDLRRSLRVSYLQFLFNSRTYLQLLMSFWHSENLSLRLIVATFGQIIFCWRENHKILLESSSFGFIVLLLLISYWFPVFIYMFNLKSSMGLRFNMKISE